MKIIEKILVDLSDFKNPDRLGHISKYILDNGNKYFVYFLEMRYFSFKEISPSGKIINQGSKDESYDYKLDIMFADKSRYCDWNF